MKELMCVLKVIHDQAIRPAIHDQHIVHDGIEQHISGAMMSLIEQLCTREALLFKVIEIHAVVRCKQGHAHFGRRKRIVFHHTRLFLRLHIDEVVRLVRFQSEPLLQFFQDSFILREILFLLMFM